MGENVRPSEKLLEISLANPIQDDAYGLREQFRQAGVDLPCLTMIRTKPRRILQNEEVRGNSPALNPRLARNFQSVGLLVEFGFDDDTVCAKRIRRNPRLFHSPNPE